MFAYKPPSQTRKAKTIRVIKGAALAGLGVSSTATVANALAPKLSKTLRLTDRRLALAGLVGGGIYGGIKSYRDEFKPQKIKVIRNKFNY